MTGASVKQCSRCRTVRPVAEFAPDKNHSSGLRSQCRSCRREGNRLYNAAHREERRAKARIYASKAKRGHRAITLPERSRANRLKMKFGMTIEAYESLLARQQGVCAVCQNPCSSGRRLAVDHDHRTGAVRGLLCGKCNTAIGAFRDDPALLLRASQYVQSARQP